MYGWWLGPVVHPEVGGAHADLLGADAGLLVEVLPRVAHLLDAATARRVRSARAGDLEDPLHQVVVVEHGGLGDGAQAVRAEGG